MANLLLGIGTNLGDRAQNLATARALLHQRIGPLRRVSPVYVTEAWGLTDQPAFLNQALLLSTDLLPVKSLEIALAIEVEMGRVREQKWGPRLIDVDLLFYDDLVLEHPQLRLPHPFVQERRFVLRPLADVAPDWRHPTLEKSIADLLRDCPDKGEVSLWSGF